MTPAPNVTNERPSLADFRVTATAPATSPTPMSPTSETSFKGTSRHRTPGSMRDVKAARRRDGKSLLPKRDLLMVVTQLSIMLRSGVDLAEAVRSIATRSRSGPVRDLMSDVYAALESGNSLSQAMEDQRHRFGGVTVASVAAGEASGCLPDVLVRLRGIIRDELRLHGAIRSAVSYPLVLMTVTALVLVAMIFFVLPQFAGIYAASRAPTPIVTRLLLDSAEWARSYWWLCFGGVAVTVFATIRFTRSTWGRRYIDRGLLHWPLARTICPALLSGRMFRLQGVMLESGVPMLEVLQLTRDSVGNGCFAELIDAIEDSVVNGECVGTAIRDSICIPEGAAEMVATAEANGQLGTVLQTVGEFYESEGEQHLQDAVKIVEPAIIVGLGLIVGVIVLAVMLPLLDLSTAGGM